MADAYLRKQSSQRQQNSIFSETFGHGVRACLGGYRVDNRILLTLSSRSISRRLPLQRSPPAATGSSAGQQHGGPTTGLAQQAAHTVDLARVAAPGGSIFKHVLEVPTSCPSHTWRPR